ncbi:hypothetical protein ACGF07_31830 [Kitasatospora sp. NPDC048194]|uniref:hypothetical protein n=1 Tax=Kitasatospora sp. NPDC048194 TaxID=3364045 RepID=UPI003715D365
MSTDPVAAAAALAQQVAEHQAHLDRIADQTRALAQQSAQQPIVLTAPQPAGSPQ